MTLKHYTANLDTAKSIISSEQLWMGRTGEAPKDKNEILHYFNIFNDLHSLYELKNLMVASNRTNSNRPLYLTQLGTIAQSYCYRERNLRIGDILADIIREESHIICFTEETSLNSGFHENTYGDICFHFESNPLVESAKSNFIFLQNKINYYDMKVLDEIKETIDNIYRIILGNQMDLIEINKKIDVILLDIDKSILNSLNKKDMKIERKKMEKLTKKLFDSLENIHLEFFEHSQNMNIDFTLKEFGVSLYLNDKVNNRREEKMLKNYSLEKANYFKAIRQFRHNSIDGHLRNIVACFIKGSEFIEDNETRIIALPNSTYTNPDGYFLKVPIDFKKLKKITISTLHPERENAIKELSELLVLKGISHVVIN